MQLNELHAFCVYGVYGCYVFSMGFFISYLRHVLFIGKVTLKFFIPHF